MRGERAVARGAGRLQGLHGDGGGARQAGGGQVRGRGEGLGGAHDGPERRLVVVGARVGVGVLRGGRAGGGRAHHRAARVYGQLHAVPLVGPRRECRRELPGHPYTKPKATINL